MRRAFVTEIRDIVAFVSVMGWIWHRVSEPMQSTGSNHRNRRTWGISGAEVQDPRPAHHQPFFCQTRYYALKKNIRITYCDGISRGDAGCGLRWPRGLGSARPRASGCCGSAGATAARFRACPRVEDFEHDLKSVVQ